MMRIDFAVLTDGGSDRVLVRIAQWVFEQHVRAEVPVQGRHADLSGMPQPPRSLQDRIDHAIKLYPCDVILVHRDAEAHTFDARFAEIQEAIHYSRIPRGFPLVCVVPIRMTEAWLLFNEPAIRRAAGNPNGTMELSLPVHVEAIPDPKEVLFEAMAKASGLTGRRLKLFRPEKSRSVLGNLIDDWSPLRQLSAFKRFETDLRNTVETMLQAKRHD
ncbi:MAG: hypothetical protein IT449_09285 [Phycisphaerales bacterium]|nr:hypothetical protein [Phycisphaerales bacterium]